MLWFPYEILNYKGTVRILNNSEIIKLYLVKTESGKVFSMVMKRVEKGKEAAIEPSSQNACNDMATWPENK